MLYVPRTRRQRQVCSSAPFGNTEVRDPIQYGIGINGGEVIVGDVGFRGRTVFTALGDSVNVAARLQDLNKTLDCRVVIADEVCRAAGLAEDALTRTEVQIRGQEKRMAVRIGKDPTVLTSALGRQAAAGHEQEPEIEEAQERVSAEGHNFL